MEKQKLTFEDFGHENGIKFWWASEFGEMLNYANYQSFKNPINKAIQSCMSANIDYNDDFLSEKREVDGKIINDYKLSRFACYMVAMNSDTKKPIVAKAQVYFADQVEKINLVLEGRNDLERLNYREELKIGQLSFAEAAKKHGVVNYGLFQNAGYRGMYNQSVKQLKEKKGLKPSTDHFEFMGRTELAANLFRITLTEERLKQKGVRNERVAMGEHNSVGKEVRNMVKKNTGHFPEELPVERRLGDVRKELKKATKKLNSKKPD